MISTAAKRYRNRMPGNDEGQEILFSFLSSEERTPQKPSLPRTINNWERSKWWWKKW